MNQRLGTAAINALKGSLIGAANTIPGVSGGTIAVITHIYDELIASVGGFFRTGWKKNTAFLAPIVLGVGLGVVVFARIVDFFLVNYPMQTAFFFIGLILGSVPFLVKITLRARFRPVHLVSFAIAFGALLAMTIIGRPPASEPITTLTLGTALPIFLAGVISAATMVIPGVSGSFVLLLIGMYSTFIRSATDFNLPILAVLLPGLAVGIVVVSKLINYLLSRFHGITYWAIIGLVLGSVVAIWPRTETGGWEVPEHATALLTAIGALIVGFLLAYFLGSERRERVKTEVDHEG